MIAQANLALQKMMAPSRKIASRRFTTHLLASTRLIANRLASRATPALSSPPPRCTFSTTSTGTQASHAENSSVTSTSSGDSIALGTRYQALVDTGILRDDDHQRSIIKDLQGLHDELKTYKQPPVPDPEEAVRPKPKSLLSWLPFGNKSQDNDHKIKISKGIPKGLYLYGDVGTGKSMLMDLFYDTLPVNVTRKRRVHFHQFMIEAHRRSHYYKSKTHRPSGIVMMMSNPASQMSSSSSSGPSGEESDAIEAVAREMASQWSVLCFDEFQVTDIADAMILRGLLERMLSYGVICVMTSNRHPDELYKNGIQRSSFIPCIELLKDQFKVTDLNSGTDYRKVPRALAKVYYSPLDDANVLEMDKMFNAMTCNPSDPVVSNRALKIWGRTLQVPLSTQQVGRFTFDQLCGQPKSAADYIEICNNFGTIFVDNVPKMGLNQRDLARRFITFIDAAYESKTKLFASSEVPILQIFSGDADKNKPTADQMRALMDDLGLTMKNLGGSPIFTGDEELFAFARVISRLTEMGSKQYAETTRPAYKESPPEA